MTDPASATAAPHLAFPAVDVTASRHRNTRRRRIRATAAIAATTAAVLLAANAVISESTAAPAPVFQPGAVGMRSAPDPGLMALADTVQAGPADRASGRYAYVTAVRLTRHQPEQILVEDLQRWTAADESGATFSRRYTVPAWTVTEDTAPPTDFNAVPATVTTNSGWPQHLPRTESTCPPGSVLRDRLQGPRPEKEPSARVLESVANTQLRTGLTLACRKAALRTLAITAGTVLTGPVRDPIGRPGTGIDTTGDGIRHRLIVDTLTGTPLAYTAWHDGTGPDTGLLTWTVVTSSTRTDQTWPVTAPTAQPRPATG
ncbi:hypothetical protein F4553_001953 [Allocatelliglobosispora scoriae]|uniref:CU044_5270 family protein n=1 Tax=Allocatelliglobosispora scoriae TaxID=643052 RepID=A0A841BJX8_9ACTN|nr:hypothetical protein [Allocatelliglobosispora scoriae]MBB5868574.1 hypothetical protein [Allocatelliglobosispora scoriae]